MTPAATLQQWLQSNPAAPPASRHVAGKLLRYSEAAALWAEFARFGAQPLAVLHDLGSAWVTSQAEVGRQQTPKEEAQALALVADRLQALRDAIERAPLPKAWSQTVQLAAEGLPTAMLRIGWRDLPDTPALSAVGYPLSVVEVLDVAQALLEQHRANLPARAVGKRKKLPALRAFVHRLAPMFAARFATPKASELHAAIAHCTNALFDGNDSPLDAAEVRSILKTSSPEFKSRS